MKKAIIAIIAIAIAAALGVGSYFIFSGSNDEGAVTVSVDDFLDSPDILEALMTRPERFTKALENEYQLGAEKTAEFYECPEEWLTYAELITIKNETNDYITVYGLEIADNGKNGVYVSTALDGEIEIEPGSSSPASFNIVCDNGDLSTDEAKVLVSDMDIKLIYRDSTVIDNDSSLSYAGYKTADVNNTEN